MDVLRPGVGGGICHTLTSVANFYKFKSLDLIPKVPKVARKSLKPILFGERVAFRIQGAQNIDGQK